MSKENLNTNSEQTQKAAGEAVKAKKPVCWLSTLAGISMFLFVPAFVLMIMSKGIADEQSRWGYHRR